MPKSKGQSKQRKPESRSISKRWLPWLRLAWILVVVISIGLSALSWSILYQRGLGECSLAECEEALQLEDAEQLVPSYQSLGLSLEAALALQITVEALAMLPFFLVALILFARRFNERVGLLGSFMLPSFAAIALGPASILVAVSSPVGVLARVLAIIGQSAFLVFFLIFPDGRFVPRWTIWIGAIWTAMFLALVPFGLNPLDYIGPAFFLFLLAIAGSQIYRYRKVSSAIEKQQTKWVVIGLAFSIGGFTILLGGFSLYPNWEETQFGLVTIVLDLLVYFFLSSVAIFIGIAILRNRLWDIEVVINRALIYGPLSAFLAGVFAASVALINQFAKESFGAEATTTAAVISALVVASVFQPLKGRIEKWINTRIYPDSINLHKEFIEFSPEVRSVIGLKDLLKVVVQKTAGLVNAQHTAILLVGRPGFSRVAAYPSASKGAATYKPDKSTQAELQKGRAVSKGNQQGLWVPLYLRRMRNHDVIGVLDVGQRANKTGFSSDDKKALAALGAEIGTSIYTAQLRERKR
jgi:hypothetical protein